MKQMGKMNHSEHISDFYQYLSGENGVNPHSRTNYISWLRFLDSQGYPLAGIETLDDIDDILAIDKLRQQEFYLHFLPFRPSHRIPYKTMEKC